MNKITLIAPLSTLAFLGACASPHADVTELRADIHDRAELERAAVHPRAPLFRPALAGRARDAYRQAEIAAAALELGTNPHWIAWYERKGPLPDELVDLVRSPQAQRAAELVVTGACRLDGRTPIELDARLPTDGSTMLDTFRLMRLSALAAAQRGDLGTAMRHALALTRLGQDLGRGGHLFARSLGTMYSDVGVRLVERFYDDSRAGEPVRDTAREGMTALAATLVPVSEAIKLESLWLDLMLVNNEAFVNLEKDSSQLEWILETNQASATVWAQLDVEADPSDQRLEELRDESCALWDSVAELCPAAAYVRYIGHFDRHEERLLRAYARIVGS